MRSNSVSEGSDGNLSGLQHAVYFQNSRHERLLATKDENGGA